MFNYYFLYFYIKFNSKIVDSKRFVMLKIIERNTNPNANFINTNKRINTNVSFNTISEIENNELYISSSSSSSEDEKS